MTRPSLRTLVVILASILVASLAGCSAKDSAVVMPDEDPLCGIFPTGLVASMVTPGTYTKAHVEPLSYDKQFAIALGECVLSNDAGYFGVLALDSYSFTEIFSSNASLNYYETCEEIPVDLTPPRVGQIVTSGACIQEEGKTFHTAWALFWGGRYDSRDPVCSKISVSIISPKNRDGIADATQILQMVLDFIDQSYAADPSAASTETTAPGATPVPSSTPS